MRRICRERPGSEDRKCERYLFIEVHEPFLLGDSYHRIFDRPSPDRAIFFD